MQSTVLQNFRYSLNGIFASECLECHLRARFYVIINVSSRLSFVKFSDSDTNGDTMKRVLEFLEMSFATNCGTNFPMLNSPKMLRIS